MIWLTEARTGREIGINPADIVTVEEFEGYMNPRDGAPNTFTHSEEVDPHGTLYGRGATVTLRGKGEGKSHSVEQIPADIRDLLKEAK